MGQSKLLALFTLLGVEKQGTKKQQAHQQERLRIESWGF